jgi:hypothetical protein
MNNILEAARHNLDHEIEFKVLHEYFYDNTLYHSACMTNYLLKTPKEKVSSDSTLCSFPSFLYVLFVQNIQDCQSGRVVITDEAAGEFIQALSVFFLF